MNEDYLTICDNVLMYTTTLNNNVLIKEKKGEKVNYSFFSVNNTGKMILEEITGKMTLEDFIQYFVEMVEIDYEENQKWIREFIFDLKEKGAVKFSKEPSPCEKIKNIGSDDLISPMHATIEVTDKCNLRCKHCYLEAAPEKRKMLSLEKFKAILEELEKNMVVNVEFTGGELFVNPDIFDILRLAYEKFTIIGILTNGTILPDNVLQLLAENKERTVVNISIDSVDSEMHDCFRGVPGAFHKTYSNVKRLIENGISVRIASSIFKENMWQIDKLAQLAVDLGAKMFSFNFVEEFGRGNNLFRDAYQDLNIEEYINYLNNEVIEKYRGIIPIQQGEGILGVRNCGAGVNSIVIDPEGKIRPCVLSPAWCDMGNILDEKFTSIMKKDIYRQLAGILPPYKENGCDKECRYLSYCKGCYLKGFQTCKNTGKVCSWIKTNGLENIFAIYSKEGI